MEKLNTYEKVKKIADDAKLSISAVETKANVANGTISGWKTGKPYAETLKKVADALDVSIEALL